MSLPYTLYFHLRPGSNSWSTVKHKKKEKVNGQALKTGEGQRSRGQEGCVAIANAHALHVQNFWYSSACASFWWFSGDVVQSTSKSQPAGSSLLEEE